MRIAQKLPLCGIITYSNMITKPGLLLFLKNHNKMKILVHFCLISLSLCVILSSSAANQLKENSATHFDLIATTEERHTVFPLIMIFFSVRMVQQITNCLS